jgi:NADPH2:quinone reductase
MHVVRVAATGGPELMQLDEVATPTPGPGQLLVRVEAAGVNFIDTYERSGAYRVTLPHALGREGAGVVEAVGPEVVGFVAGDRVAWCDAPGSYATHALVPAARAVPVPAGVPSATAAALLLQGMTAHYLATSTVPLAPGDACVIHAGAGGTGLLLTQIAKRRGARVLTTVSTDEKAELSRRAGADEVVLYTRDDFAAAARRMTGGRGVRVVYDSVGQTTFDASLSALARRGTLVLFGQSSGRVPPVDPQRLNSGGSLFLTRPKLGDYVDSREELLARAHDVLGWARAGALEVRVGATFPLAEAAAAHRALEGRATTGKVLLAP